VGRLAGGIAHDFNNMLTPILGYSEILSEDLAQDDPRQAGVAQITRAATHAHTLTQQLLAFARKQTLEMKPLDLNQVVARFEGMLRRVLRENIVLETHLAGSLGLFSGDVGQIEQIIMNLALNAQDAMPEGGTLVIETQEVVLDESYASDHEEVTPGPHVMLAVSDTGAGMDEGTLGKIFEPFFTTKGIGRGTGLGLSTVHGIVKQHGGSIWVYSELGKGTTFKIYFPLAEETRPVPVSGRTRTEATAGTETILVAEDEEQVKGLACEILRRNGYTVFEASDGKGALELAEAYEGPIHLLVTDVVMPDMNGKILHQHLSVARPGLKVLYMSGYSENVIAHHGVLDEGVNFVQKPFSFHGLATRVRDVLDLA
jgi:CheY-like chemotaxis protein